VIVGAGGPASALAVTRLQPDGSSDNSFDGDGIAGVDLGGGEWAEAVALQADGRIVAAGGTSRNSDVAVVRFKAAGPADMTLDGDFGAGGVRVFGYGGTDLARDVLIQADGKIVVAGKGAANEALVATRLDASGLPDPSFDGDGNSLVDFGKEEEGEAALLQPNGKIVLVGNTSAGDDIAIARLQPGGTLDTTFASDGKVAINFGGADYGKAAALQADGKMVIAGSTDGGATVARIEADPPAGTEDGPGGGGPVSGPGAPLCAGRSATVVGTMGRDLLRGTRRADVIVALAGNDRVSGAGGADLVCGGRGNDSLRLGRGPDRIHGERGKDMLSGGPGKDLLKGGPGNDRLAGGSHLDRCLGGPGRDRARTCEN
jgi:uncharacterized delta-60 repeat protein